MRGIYCWLLQVAFLSTRPRSPPADGRPPRCALPSTNAQPPLCSEESLLSPACLAGTSQGRRCPFQTGKPPHVHPYTVEEAWLHSSLSQTEETSTPASAKASSGHQWSDSQSPRGSSVTQNHPTGVRPGQKCALSSQVRKRPHA